MDGILSGKFRKMDLLNVSHKSIEIPTCLASRTNSIMRYGNTITSLRKRMSFIFSVLVFGAGLCAFLLIGIEGKSWESTVPLLIGFICFFTVISLLAATPTLAESIHLRNGWIEHRLFNKWIISRDQISDFVSMRFPAILQFRNGTEIRLCLAEKKIVLALESELNRRVAEARMKYELAVGGVNASQLLDPERPIFSENPEIIVCAHPVTLNEMGNYEHVVLFKTHSSSALESEIRKVLLFMRGDKLKELNNLFFTIAIFPDIDDYSNSLVLPPDVLGQITDLGFAVKIVSYQRSSASS